MELTNETRAAVPGDARNEHNAQAANQTRDRYTTGCAIFKLPIVERRALLDAARANLAAASVWLDTDPPPGRCAACGLHLTGAPFAKVRTATNDRVQVHQECWNEMRAGRWP